MGIEAYAGQVGPDEARKDGRERAPLYELAKEVGLMAEAIRGRLHQIEQLNEGQIVGPAKVPEPEGVRRNVADELIFARTALMDTMGPLSALEREFGL